MTLTKSIFISKTFWVNAAALVGGLATYFTNGDTAGLIAAAMGIVNVGLRWATTQPVTLTGTAIPTPPPAGPVTEATL